MTIVLRATETFLLQQSTRAAVSIFFHLFVVACLQHATHGAGDPYIRN